MNQAVTRIDLLRHGKLATEGLFCAHADEPLSKQGVKSLIVATEKGNWDVIVSSPHLRCKAYAAQLAEQRSCELHIEDSFKEMDFGRWTGVAMSTLWGNEAEQLQQLWQSPDDFTAPDGEAMADFVARVHEGLQYIQQRYQHQSILLITHAGVIRTILAKALGVSLLSAQKFAIDYASLTCLYHYSDGEYALQSLQQVNSLEDV